MNRSRMTSMYEDFDDNDNMEGNDDDMEALGSILSWDDNEDNDNGGTKSDDERTNSTNQHNSATGMSAPFESLQFTSRSSMPGLGFMQNTTSSFNCVSQTDKGNNSSNGISFQFPVQTPLPCFPQQQMQQGQNAQSNGPMTRSGTENSVLETPCNQVLHVNINQQQQQQQQGMQLSLSTEQQQFIAQNPQAFVEFLASTVFQQGSHPNQQQLPQQQQLQQQQQSSHNLQNQVSQTQAQTPLPPMFSIPSLQPTTQNMMQPPKQQSLQIDPQATQQTQPAFVSDPSAILQQYQIAQLQQQLQASQSQQQNERQCQQQPINQPLTLQIQSALQQLQAQFAQAQGNFSQTQTNPTQVSREGPTPIVGLQSITPQHPALTLNQGLSSVVKQSSPMPNPKKLKSLPIDQKKKTPPATIPSSKISTKSSLTAATGTVSASDTEGEASRKALSASVLEDIHENNDTDYSVLPSSEKMKSNRDRNREHARNTRLRKKAYLEKLKHTVDELCRERETLVAERANAANLLVEMNNIRTEVLMSLLALRTSNERRRKLWSSILDESCFVCVMPVTPYRSFPTSEVQVSKCQRTILGIDGMMADTASLHVLCDCLVDRSVFPFEKINVRYTLVTEEAVVAGNQMMARWVMTTTNAVQYGARMEVAKQGMLCCKFNSSNKITNLEFMFDVMAFMLQLKQASGSEGFTVVPNTLQTCQRSFDKPMVMTQAEHPYTIIQVNKLWEDMTGYTCDEVVGRASCAILQGADMDKTTLKGMMDEVRYNRPASALLVNRRKTGEEFTNFLVVYPLSTDSRITFFLGLTLSYTLGKPCRSSGSIQGSNVIPHTQHTNQQQMLSSQEATLSIASLATNLQNQPSQSQSLMPNVLLPHVDSISNSSLVQNPSQGQFFHSIQASNNFSSSLMDNKLKRLRGEEANNTHTCV